ncbi:Response regulator protein VraR [Streptomyces xanthophaeus]|nr:Response regulator protein VraR [Streptomyces xanthophaeus]
MFLPRAGEAVPLGGGGGGAADAGPLIHDHARGSPDVRALAVRAPGVRSLAAARAETRTAAAPWVARLTDREAEVLRLMAAGLSNQEMTGSLGVGAQTVKTHVASVLAKTGSRDRTQAVIAAYEGGFMRKG